MPRPPQLPALTSIRFFAAFWVVIFHVTGPFWPRMPLWAVNIASAGYAGVGLFFILSGFILTYIYGSEVERISRKRFWISRFARLYPVYALALVVSLPFTVEGFRAAHSLLLKGAYGLTFGLAPALLQSWIPSCAGRWNASGWSLSAEAFFYVVFPFLLIPLTPRRTRLLVPFMMAMWGIACSVASLYLLIKPDGIAHLDIYSNSIVFTFVKFNPLVRLPEFVLGMALSRYYQATKDRCSCGWSLAALTTALIAAVLVFSDKLPLPLLHNGLLDPLWCMLIYGLATARNTQRSVLNAPVLVLLGEASYSLYILHWPILEWLGRMATKLGIDAAASLSWTVMEIALMLIVSIICFRFFETPIRRKIVARF